jgi:hypothetical protein
MFDPLGLKYRQGETIMPSRGRHQSSSKECHQIMRKIEALDGVVGVIIGRSYGGKSLGAGSRTGSLKVQRKVPGGLKAVTQSAKGLQEIFIRTAPGKEDLISAEILKLSDS